MFRLSWGITIPVDFNFKKGGEQNGKKSCNHTFDSR
jgi:hypothetical protein